MGKSLSLESSKEYDIYDFDHTIYSGDSSVDFYFFCIIKRPHLLRYLPYQVWHYVLFILGLNKRTEFKSKFFIFLRGLEDVEESVNQFWKSHQTKIKKWYKVKDHKNDFIISASPDFLLYPIFNKLQAHRLIATNMDYNTGTIKGSNCYGSEKLNRLLKEIKKPKIRHAYTDNISDLPILKLAKEAFIVKGNRVYTLQEYKKQSRIKRFFQSFNLLTARSIKF